MRVWGGIGIGIGRVLLVGGKKHRIKWDEIAWHGIAGRRDVSR